MSGCGQASSPLFHIFTLAGTCQSTLNSLWSRQPPKPARFPQPLEQLLRFLYKTLLTILLQQFISGYTER